MDPHRRAPVLSPESHTPPAARGRSSLLERARCWFRRSDARDVEAPWFLEGLTVLTPEGSAEVLEEIRNGSPDTPERMAMFARMQRRAEIRKRLAVEAETAQLG